MRSRVLFAAVLAGLSFAPSALAQDRFLVNRFEPSERGSDWFSLDSLDLRGEARPAIGVVGDYSARSLVLYNPDDSIKESVVRNQFIVHAGASFVFLNRFRIAADMPFQLFADGHNGTANGVTFLAPANDQALGDLRFSADARLIGEYGDAFTAAIGAQVSLPTGDQDSYMSDGSTRFMPRATVAGDVGPLAYSARLAIQYRGAGTTVDGTDISSEFNFGGAVGLRALDKMLLIGPEIYGSTTFDNAFDKKSTPVEGLFGPHIFLPNGLRFGAGIGTGLTRGYGAPVVRTVGNIEWAMPYEKHEDRDHDMIEDQFDACPDTPGVPSQDPAKNGCPPPPPPPPDRDGDGIIDSEDACVDVPGVKSDDPKKNGCPADQDGDGIPDVKDACPTTPGVANDDPKKNGCPPDRDNDGILDADDACPDTPGVKSTIAKYNGCPDDVDHDGIKNDVDACPENPGPSDPDPKRNGCPKAFIAQGQIKILDQVKFKTNSAAIVVGKDSDDVLQAVLKIFQDHPDIVVSVEGHTDNTGTAAHNKTLSAQRAASVVTWLVKHGVDKKRLTSVGFGQEKPIADNGTPEGRAENRRVEFHIAGGGSQ